MTAVSIFGTKVGFGAHVAPPPAPELAPPPAPELPPAPEAPIAPDAPIEPEFVVPGVPA